MKEIITIIVRLTVACLLAGLVMGTTFVFTSKAKKHNMHQKEQQVMLSLLGYTAEHPAPATLAMHEVYRYLVSEQGSQSMGYLLPAGEGKGSFTFVAIDLDGKFLAQTPVTIDQDKVTEETERTAAIQTALGAAKELKYTDQTIIVTQENKRVAYLLPGKFPGFKTFIGVILALDHELTIRGLEIMEHEEDPVKKLDVVKTPLPEEYREALEAETGGKLSADQVAKVEAQYKDKDIYALTGATISSLAVTNGVKGIAQKFAYRLGILDRVIKEQKIVVPF